MHARYAVPAVLLSAVVAALAVRVGFSGAEGPTLTGTVGPGFTISLVDAGGIDVSTLAPGPYSVVVNDNSSAHNFHLTGPGVDYATEVDVSGQVTWELTFSPGSHHFQCDVHVSMSGDFTVGGAPPAPPPAPPPPPPTPAPPPPPTPAPPPPPPPTSTTSTTTPPTSPTTSTTTSTPTSTATGSSSTSTTSTVTTQRGPAATPLRVTGAQVIVGRQGGRRWLQARFRINKAATARIRLLRGSKAVARAETKLAAGQRTVRMRVPLGLPRGLYRFEIELRAASARRVVSRVIRL